MGENVRVEVSGGNMRENCPDLRARYTSLYVQRL